MASQRLINSTEQLKEGMGAINSDLDFPAIQSFVDDAEMNHVIPAIGYSFYDILRGDTLNAQQQRALSMLRKAITNFTIHYYVAFGAVQVTEAGIIVRKDDKRLPASDKKTVQLRMQSRADGFKALEAAINYLEANPTDYPQYITDKAHQLNRQYYINTTADFSAGFDLDNNAEVFARLKSVMSTVEENYIDNILGDTVSGALRSAILSNSTTNLQDQLLVRIAKAVAPLTIAEAIPYRLVNVTAAGLVTATLKGNIENAEQTTEGDLNRLQAFMIKALSNGQSAQAKLTKWLNDRATDFTGYTTINVDAPSTLNDTNRGFLFV